MSLKRTSWTDPEGRKHVVLLPEGAENAEMGVPLGPPSLAELGLPTETEIRLSNELVNRGIITAADALKNRAEIALAIQSALKVDTDKVIRMYVGPDFKNAKQAKTPEVAVRNGAQAQQRRRR